MHIAAAGPTGVSADGWLALAVALVLGIPTLIWTVRGARKEPYRLEYYYWAASTLLTLPPRSMIEVRVNGQLVRTAWQLTVRFVNTGTQPIRPDEWSQPIRLVFPEDTQPISSVLSAVKQNGLELATRVEGQTVEILPVLLNQGDLFEIQIVGDGPYAQPEAMSRIANLPSMKKRTFIYNPGNGPEGRLEAGNRLMQAVFYLLGVGLALLALFAIKPFAATSVILAVGVLIAFDVLLPLFVRSADKRRDVWRPTLVITDPTQPLVPVAPEMTAPVTEPAEDAATQTHTPSNPRIVNDAREAVGRVAEAIEALNAAPPSWRVDRSGPAFWSLINERALVAKNVRLSAAVESFRMDANGVTWFDLSGTGAVGEFDGEITSEGQIHGANFEVSWVDRNGVSHREDFKYMGF
ncbi:MAG: hypothetical protein ABIP33_07805 [Pseudolysinimonas sp.]